MNEKQSFESDEKFFLEDTQSLEDRYNKIKEGLFSLKVLCSSHSQFEKAEDAILLESMADVLESLEKTFIHHFGASSGRTISPKSDEPWD
jgi:hypothetical protein